MTAAMAAPGVGVRRALLGYPKRHKVSDAVATLLFSRAWLQASVLLPASSLKSQHAKAVAARALGQASIDYCLIIVYSWESRPFIARTHALGAALAPV